MTMNTVSMTRGSRRYGQRYPYRSLTSQNIFSDDRWSTLVRRQAKKVDNLLSSDNVGSDALWLILSTCLCACPSTVSRCSGHQAIKQKLHIMPRMLKDDLPVTDVQEAEDKAEMLLGAKLLVSSFWHQKRSSVCVTTSRNALTHSLTHTPSL